MEIPAPQAGSSGTPSSVSGTGASASIAATSAETAKALTVSAYVQSSQPVNTAEVPASSVASSSSTPSSQTSQLTPSTTNTSTTSVSTTSTSTSTPSTTVPAPPTTSVAKQAPSVQAAAPITTPKLPTVSSAPPASTSSAPPAVPATYMLDLLVNTQRNVAPSTTVTGLNDQTIKLLAQGQVVRLVAQSPVPVTPGSVLQLQWTPVNGMRILQIHPPEGIPPSVRSFVGAAMSGQGSPAPILQALQQLLASATDSDTPALPEGIGALGRQLLALLPDNNSVRRPGVLQQFVSQSGLFMEAAILKEATTQRTAGGTTSFNLGVTSNTTATPTGGQSVSTQSGGSDVPGAFTSDNTNETTPSTLLKVLGQLREHLRGSEGKAANTPSHAGSNHETSSTAPSARAQSENGHTTESTNTSKPGSSPATPSVAGDFKALLLQLQQQIHIAREKAAVTPQQSTQSLLGGEQPAVKIGSAGIAGEQNIAPPTPSPTIGTPNSTPIPPSSNVVTNTGSTTVLTDVDNASPVTTDSNVGTEDAAIGSNITPGSRGAPGKEGLDVKSGSIAAKLPIDKSGAVTEETPTTDAETPPAPLLRHTRLARAADQYQRLEQITRPPSPRPPSPGVTNATTQQELLDTAIQWAEMATDIDIPGLGLPLPHRQRLRIDDGRDSLDNLLGMLLKRTQEALNRLHLHQLSHAGATTRDSGTQQQNPPLTFDLPIFFDGQINVFNTRIDEEELPAGENAQSEQKVKQWSVSLGFDIEGLGPMFCQLQMSVKQANLQFWADRPATLALTREHIVFLSRSLHDLGVSVSEVSCHEGIPKQTRTRLSQQLVDINT